MGNFKNLYEQLERMTELINYNNSFIEDDCLIYEGLIRTTPLKLAKNLLEKMFLSIGYGKNIFSTKLKIGPITTQPKITIDKDDTLTVSFLPLRNDIEDIKQMLKLINNLGYFISTLKYKERIQRGDAVLISYDEKTLMEISEKYNILDVFDVVLEAKFDIERDVPEKLYHVTRQEVLPKIMKIGLTPRSESKLSTHPERIYFGLDYKETLKLVDIFKVQAKKNNKDQKFVVLEIDTKQVKHIKVFDDPNFKGYGYYILVNVHPNAIRILKENL